MNDYPNMQSDYIFFVYGLVFTIMSAICAVRYKNREYHAPWLMLGMFGLLHGISAWLDMVVMSIGNSLTFTSLRLVLTLISLLFLIRFGIHSEYRAKNTDKRLIILSLMILAVSDIADDLNLPDIRFQIFRLFLAILTVYALWQDFSRLRIRNRYLTEISLGIILLAGWIITEKVGYRSEVENQNYLLIRAKIAAASFNIDRIKSLSGSPADTDTPAHIRLTEQLGKIREANPDCRYVYLMAMKEGKVIFLADSAPYGSEEFVQPGQIYHEASSEMKNLFSDGIAIVEGPLPDQWGIWVSGLVPITDKQSRKVLAILGMDVDVKNWSRAITRHRLIPILITLLTLVVVLVFFAAQQKLRRSRKDWKDVFEAVGHPMIVMDTQHYILAANRATAKAIGMSYQGIIGKKCYQIFHNSDHPPHICPMGTLLESGKLTPVEMEMETVGNKIFMVFCTPIMDEEGHIVRIIHVATDITERKHMEQNILAAKEAAESASRAKSEFISHISHELRTPLNGILGYAQLLGLNNKGFSSEQIEQITMIHRCGEHLLTMINDILDFSKIEAEKLEIESSEINFLEFLKITANMAEVQASQKGLSFAYEPCSELPCLILGDEKRLRQILLNLLSNAIRYTENGKVMFRVIALPPDTDHSFVCCFEVEDTGIGIPSDQIGRIFEPFHQIGSPHQGTGLGLAITQNLIRKMNGELYVSSVEGRGSIFGFRMRFPIISEQYVRSQPKIIQANHPEIQDFRIPAAEELKRFLMLVDTGNVAVILQQTLLYRDSGSEFASFWEMIYNLVQTLQLKKIKCLLRQYMENVE